MGTSDKIVSWVKCEEIAGEGLREVLDIPECQDQQPL